MAGSHQKKRPELGVVSFSWIRTSTFHSSLPAQRLPKPRFLLSCEPSHGVCRILPNQRSLWFALALKQVFAKHQTSKLPDPWQLSGRSGEQKYKFGSLQFSVQYEQKHIPNLKWAFLGCWQDPPAKSLTVWGFSGNHLYFPRELKIRYPLAVKIRSVG